MNTRFLSLSLCPALALLVAACSEAPVPRDVSLTAPALAEVGQEVELEVTLGAGLTAHAVEIVDQQLGRLLLVATAAPRGDGRFVARWRPSSDDEGAYALQAKVVSAGGDVLLSGGAALRVRSIAPFARRQKAGPAGLAAVAGDGQVELTWDAVKRADGYYVYRGTTSGFTPSEANRIADTSAASLTDEDVVNGTTYHYRVSSYTFNWRKGAAVESAAAGPVSAQPTAGSGAPPPDTTPPTVTITSPASDASYTAAQTLQLVASAADDLGVVKVEFFDGASLVGTDTSAPYSHDWSFTAADNGDHAWTARAHDAAGNATTSTVRTLTVAIAAPPPAPTGVSASGGDGQVTVSWSPAPGATSYNIYWATTSGVTPSSGTKIAGVSSPHLHDGLVNGVTYYYVVTAVGAAGEGPASSEASASPQAAGDTAAPLFAGLGSATAVSSSQIDLAWSAATDDTSPASAIVYEIYQSSSAAVDFSAPTYTTAPGATSLAVTGLSAATTYHFAVRARDAAGNRDANSVVQSATTMSAGSWPTDWAALEDQVLTLVNQHRALGATCGSSYMPPVGALTMHQALRLAARLHSKDMADNNYFSHTSLDGRSPWTRMHDAGYTGSAMGENIAAGYSTPAAVVAGWMASTGHCNNIMRGTFTVIGVGYAYKTNSTYRSYWTQDFGNGS